MNIRSSIHIFRKEMRDILRDRRTLYSMILFPILLIPLLYLGIGAFMAKRMGDLKDQRSEIIWIEHENASDLKELLEQADVVDIVDNITDTTIAFEMLRNNEIDIVVEIPYGFHVGLESLLTGNDVAVPEINIYQNKTRTSSEFASNKVIAVLSDWRSKLTEKVLSDKGLRSEIVRPFVMSMKNIASQKEMGGFVLGTMLPYMIIIMVLTGAMYPAIDLTAGEKERGTLETLLVAGVSRVDIVTGKFLTVLTASLVTAFLSILSMVFTMTQGIHMFEDIGRAMSVDIDANVIITLVLAILPLAVLFSSLLMTLSLFAKSYKEAQSYISPLMILAIIPSMASFVPDVELNYEMAMIPILNVSLLMKQAFTGTVEPMELIITMGVNILLAIGGLFLVVRMFKKESVLFRI